MAADPNTCKHGESLALVSVAYLEDIGRWTADVSIKCRLCERPFRFLGLPGGSNVDFPTASVDGHEARMPIHPDGEELPALPDGHVRGFSINAPPTH